MFEKVKSFFFLNVSPLVKKGQEKILDFDDLLPAPLEIEINRDLKVSPIDLSAQKKFLFALLLEQKNLVFKAWSFYLLGIFSSLLTPLFVNLLLPGPECSGAR